MKPEDIIRRAYDPERFRQAGHQLVDELADHLAATLPGTELPVLPWQTPEQAYEQVQKLVDQDAETLFSATLLHTIRLHHPHYAGHQITPPAPVAALAGLLSDLVNNGMGVYEVGLLGTAMERYVIKTVAHQFGMNDQADGFLTSGGTLGNLTALLAARRSQSEKDVWQEGDTGEFSVMVSDQAHYCIERAARVMGWGQQGVIPVPCNDRFQLDTSSLERCLHEARESGRTVIAVVGNAGSTATGSFDDLHGIADFCERENLWFHVDGAHGAAVAFSEKHRELVTGIERADSVVLDFHKLLLTPALATALIFREGEKGYQTFAQKAEYLWSDGQSEFWYELARRTFECTKTMYGLKVFALLTEHGTPVLEANIDCVHERARQFAELIAKADDFELLLEPQTNIVCFRYIGQPRDHLAESALNELNQTIRDKLTREGSFYIVQTDWQRTTWLRTTLANALTTPDDLQQLLDRIRTLAKTGAGQ
ncbi:MAG: aminotransferase class I/II-fold pyridoxal phosphate-dependent enzyme [Mariniblastus sp.]|nr:aminotransferase class I/II-fold pyridoxal phosphate-dependent enzyme [Mariniblastus sp.]